MGRSKEDWLEGRKAMWMEEGRQRLEAMSDLEREWRSAAEGEGAHRRGRAYG